MYLDYAEDQAERRRTLHMRDWREKLDAFLQFNERDMLRNAGRVSAEIAKQLALDAGRPPLFKPSCVLKSSS